MRVLVVGFPTESTILELIQIGLGDDDLLDILIQVSGDSIQDFQAVNSMLSKTYGTVFTVLSESNLYFVNVNVLLYGISSFNRKEYDVIVELQSLQTCGKPRKFKHVAVGGTFDHLHIGHKILLSMSAWISESKLSCGVFEFTESSLQKKKYSDKIQSLEIRIQKIKEFLLKFDPTLKYLIVPIKDAFGPTIEDSSIEALVGSLETQQGCIIVNEERKKVMMNPLELFMIPTIDSQGHETLQKLSSTFLRSLK